MERCWEVGEVGGQKGRWSGDRNLLCFAKMGLVPPSLREIKPIHDPCPLLPAWGKDKKARQRRAGGVSSCHFH